MKVIVAIDGSPSTRKVIDHCLKTDWPEDTKFKVVSVVDSFEPFPALEGLKELEVKKATELVEESAKTLIGKFPHLNVAYKVLDGYVKSELIDIIVDWQADLIVLGSHGKTGFKKLLLGSVSQAIMNHSTCSVRVVKDSKVTENGSFEVLVCLDASKFSRASLDRMLQYKWPDSCNFTLASVVFKQPEGDEIPKNSLASLEEKRNKVIRDANSLLDTAEAKMKLAFGDDVKVTKVVKQGDARKEILDLTEELNPDLVLLGSHGRALFDRMLMGSVSEAVVSHAQCPVEVVRV